MKKLIKKSFRMFTIDTNQEEAKETFKRIYGYEPQICVIDKNLLLVGPIKDDRYK
jgi:hypothetical protein